MTTRDRTNAIITEALTEQWIEGFTEGNQSASTIIMDALAKSGVRITPQQLEDIQSNLRKSVDAYMEAKFPAKQDEEYEQED